MKYRKTKSNFCDKIRQEAFDKKTTLEAAAYGLRNRGKITYPEYKAFTETLKYR
jgi:hypothetical protein